MNWLCTTINSVWLASCATAALKYRFAINDPRRAQLAVLKRLIQRNRESAFGREHGFSSIISHDGFVNRVPIRKYEAVLPWIERVQRAENSVLTSERVTHLIPTGGSTSGRKLIPFTTQLQREFDSAIGPWISDLFWRTPSLLGGPAYWSITPKSRFTENSAAVPIGFASDADYLGGIKAKLIEAVLVRPPATALTQNLTEFRFATLAALLRARGLRLISVWHPSFLTLLMDDLPSNWYRLRAELTERKLPCAVPENLCDLWPHLRVISCWSDAHAEPGARELARRFPGVKVEGKGLLATEGCISIPFQGQHPLAITSHFLEFIDESGKLHLANELTEGSIYEVVLTTGGGLWRYQLGDRVIVDGFVSNTPSVRFVGRSGQVSDLRGEKLTEEFVAGCIRRLSVDFRFALLVPCVDDEPPNYLFIFEGEIPNGYREELEYLLRQNPHYRYAREVGQLGPARLRPVASGAYTIYTEHLVNRGQRLGDIKPEALRKEFWWPSVFPPRSEPASNWVQSAASESELTAF